MKCLVTGGAGFIGSHLCMGLLSKGFDVVCLDNISTGNVANINVCRTYAEENNRSHPFTFVEGDVTTADLMQLLKGHKFDIIFHHAAVVGVKKTMEDPLLVLNDINGIKNMLEYAKNTHVKKAIYASSSEVYGEPLTPKQTESGSLNAKHPYARVKLLGEAFFEAYYQKYGLKTCSLRYFNTYGPGQRDSDYGFVVAIFIKQVLLNKAPTIFGDGSQTRAFCFIDDNVNATIAAALSEELHGQAINLGNNEEVTIKNLAERIIRLCDKDLQPIFLTRRSGDIRHRCPDISEMKRVLKYTPHVTLVEGLKKTIAWYKNHSNW